jgi:hypothetical protein
MGAGFGGGFKDGFFGPHMAFAIFLILVLLIFAN